MNKQNYVVIKHKPVNVYIKKLSNSDIPLQKSSYTPF